MRIQPGRLYQLTGRVNACVWNIDFANHHKEVIHRLRAEDVILIVKHVRERSTEGYWWMQVSCAGVLGYVKTSRVRSHLMEMAS